MPSILFSFGSNGEDGGCAWYSTGVSRWSLMIGGKIEQPCLLLVSVCRDVEEYGRR